MVRRGDFDDVRPLLLEELAIVAVSARLLAGLVALRRCPLVGRQALGVGVAQRNDLHIVNLHEPKQIVLAVPAGADQSDPALRFGSSGTHERESSRRGPHETTAIDGIEWHR